MVRAWLGSIVILIATAAGAQPQHLRLLHNQLNNDTQAAALQCGVELGVPWQELERCILITRYGPNGKLGGFSIGSLDEENSTTPMQHSSSQPEPAALQAGRYETYNQEYEQALEQRNANVPLRMVSLTQSSNSGNLTLADPRGKIFDLTRIADYVVVRGRYFNDGRGGQRWIPPETASQYLVVKRGALLRKEGKSTMVFNQRHKRPGLMYTILTLGSKYKVKFGFHILVL